ncbi:MAG: hypothetical protein V7L20_07560 [Nostoc sp.]|uniref:hypothetical protein n=1 Tax=Nostoc sp. TaxID=1180 RepID=UPI002FF4B909
MVSTSLNQLSSRELSVRVASRREVETRQQRYFFNQKSPKAIATLTTTSLRYPLRRERSQ